VGRCRRGYVHFVEGRHLETTHNLGPTALIQTDNWVHRRGERLAALTVLKGVALYVLALDGRWFGVLALEVRQVAQFANAHVAYSLR
jgi:hypothetical protein